MKTNITLTYLCHCGGYGNLCGFVARDNKRKYQIICDDCGEKTPMCWSIIEAAYAWDLKKGYKTSTKINHKENVNSNNVESRLEALEKRLELALGKDGETCSSCASFDLRGKTQHPCFYSSQQANSLKCHKFKHAGDDDEN